MKSGHSRRNFLSYVGCGSFLATLGTHAIDMGFVSQAFAEDLDTRLDFGDFEPLVCALQETPSERLQPWVVAQMRNGVELKKLIGAAALANARTFGGEDYIGFHTFMALGPALKMSRLMPEGTEALPVLKVLLRNTMRIQDVGGRENEVLRPIDSGLPDGADSRRLKQAVYDKNVSQAEQLLAGLMSHDAQAGLDSLLPAVQDHAEVHRTVLPYRAWEMQDIVGTKHALTLLRQSLHYCARFSPAAQTNESTEQAALVAALFDEFALEARTFGEREIDDASVQSLSDTLSRVTATDAARAVAQAIADGWSLSAIGEAISLAASLLVLRDPGRLPQYEDKLKLAGCVHGDSTGVHASDAANAWRHLATVASGRNQAACLLIGAWQVARDRLSAPHLMSEPLPSRYQLDRVTSLGPDQLLAQLEDAIQARQQALATAIVARCGEQQVSSDRLFETLLKFAVSEDGALHAEKYFQTVYDDFHSTRASLRWRHLMSLARVTASEYGTPAAGQEEARHLLRIDG
ncbi:MAG: hypothetical protein KDA92_07195 [Planctomycetales bacterium]|nr:hypothetical protein [Planctomycetales bacterium]